jgi:transcriptional regulator with XRE-family HTH domain
MSTGEGSAAGGAAGQGGRSLAERIEWLVANRWPAGAAAPRTNGDIAEAITAVTGEEISSTGFWKLRTGRGANPTWQTLTSFARFFGVPFGYFAADPAEAEEVGDQVALLVLLRDKGVTRRHLRSLVGLPANSRQLVLDMIDSAARIEQRHGGEG